MAIGDAAAQTGLSIDTLRYYERLGLLASVGRDAGGHRRYTERDLGTVGFINLLRLTGMSIKEMQSFMELTRAGDYTLPERLGLLEEHRDALAGRLTDLESRLEALTRKIGIYREMMLAAGMVPP